MSTHRGNRQKMKRHLSIIIPVYNEVDIITDTLLCLLTLDSIRNHEIIVVDGNPEGNTVDAIANCGIKKIVSKKGRGAQMNAGAAAAMGDNLLFLHADTFIEKGAIKKIRDVLKRPGIVGGAFDLKINSEKKVFRMIENVACVRSRLTRIPYGDQAIFIRKDFFFRIGGFREIPIMEDVDLMRRIKKAGGKIYVLPSKALTSPRRWEKEGVLYCTFRNWILIFLYISGASPMKLARFYTRF
jgi:rSAM/selenodomain-associated transferase 2